MKIKPFDADFFSFPLQPRVVALLGVAENFCPVSRHMPFSSDPFLYGFSLSKKTYTSELLQTEKFFTLQFFDNAFKNDIHALGKVSGKDIDKIEKSSIQFEEKEGFYYSPQCLWGMKLRKKDVLEMGDHFIIIGIPEEYWHQSENLLHSGKHILFYGKGWYSHSTDPIRISKNITL